MEKKEIIQNEFYKLVDIIRFLRQPEGCPWDRKQTLETMGKHIKNEADEVIEALKEKDILHIKEELGDLMMNLILTSQIADESGYFHIGEVCHDICDKLILRHPHVFGNVDKNMNAEEVVNMWNANKVGEKEAKSKLSYKMNQALNFSSSIAMAQKVQELAATVGFDFPSAKDSFYKIVEETNEVKEVLDNKDKLEEEIGDLLFAVTNVARLSGLNTEDCLKKSVNKFVRRVENVEQRAEENGGFEGKSLEELDVYWNEAKDVM